MYTYLVNYLSGKHKVLDTINYANSSSGVFFLGGEDKGSLAPLIIWRKNYTSLSNFKNVAHFKLQICSLLRPDNFLISPSSFLI